MWQTTIVTVPLWPIANNCNNCDRILINFGNCNQFWLMKLWHDNWDECDNFENLDEMWQLWAIKTIINSCESWIFVTIVKKCDNIDHIASRGLSLISCQSCWNVLRSLVYCGRASGVAGRTRYLSALIGDFRDTS